MGRIRNIDMGGATLTIEAAGSDADGRARIEVRPDADGQWSNAFWTHKESVSNLRLRALDISAPGRRAEEMVDAVNHNGSGRLEVLNAPSTASATRSAATTRAVAPASRC